MSDNTVDQAIREASQKVEAKVHESIREFVTSSDFAPSQGLDFLEAKNSLLLSYLIELTHDMRNRLQGESRSVSSQHRLTVMKTVLEKSRGLEKKLRYQIDKLLASGTNASSFVSADTEDPLQLRPDTSALRDDDDSKPVADNLSQESGDSDDDSSTSDMDDDLAAARATEVLKTRIGFSVTSDLDSFRGDITICNIERDFIDFNLSYTTNKLKTSEVLTEYVVGVIHVLDPANV